MASERRETFSFRDGEHPRPASAPLLPLDRVLRELFVGSSWNQVRRLVETGKVRVDGTVVRDPQAKIGGGAVVAIRMAAPRPELGLIGRDAVIFTDPHVVVVRKPPGIATVPFEDERDTLDRLVHGVLRKLARDGASIAPLGVVQRLDKETSGLLVFTRTTSAKRSLQQQFRDHTVHRRYLALANGAVASRTIRSRLISDRGDGVRGSTDNRDLGRDAVTHVKLLEKLAGASLVECKLETGRTHQIRIHLSEAGHPILGERVYVRGYSGPQLQAPRVMLHATELGFVHPATGQELRFTDPPPEDFGRVLERLRP